MQGFFSAFGQVVALGCAAGLVAPCAAAPDDDLRKNVVVLVDSSKSVDPINRDSALKLVAGLITGKVDDGSRTSWRFQAAQSSGYPVATINLQRLMQPGADPSQPIASQSARFVINPLGNYERVVALRTQLGQPGTGTPDEIAGRLTSPAAPFISSDNSTHISLAEAVVAQTFLKPASQMPYYLVVISDFHEDCLNRPVKEYLAKAAQVKADNARVMKGEIPFNDGAGAVNGKYSAADVEAIRFLTEKITDLLIGEFIYQGTPMPETPVNVKIYSPMVKRALAFTGDPQRWVLPDPPPGLALAAEGLEMNAPLEIRVTNLANQSEKRITETCSLILARNLLDLGPLLERAEIKSFLTPGRYGIKLSAGQAIGLSVDAGTELEIVRPQLRVEDAKLDASTEADPYEFPLNKEILAEKIILKLDPAPTTAHQVTVQCGKAKAEVTIKNGSGELGMGEMLEGSSGDGAIRLAASLPLPPTSEAATKDVWLVLPQISIWALQGGQPAAGDLITLAKERALTLKASHVGMDGMEWRGTTVTGPDREPVALRGGDNNNLDFSEVAPGTYTVIAKFGSARTPQQAEFMVVVPKRTPWMLIALGSMALVSLGLFSWHFFRR